MSDKKFTIAAEIIARSASYKAGMREFQSVTQRAVGAVKSTFDSLHRTLSTLGGKLASIGLGFGAFELIKGSALLDKSMNRLGISSGRSKEEIDGVRENLERLGMKTGQKVEDLVGGFERLLKLTGSWDQAAKSIEAVNTAVTVTGASTDLLAQSLAVAQTSFGFDLSKSGGAMEVLNKLAGIGAGAGGLENVAGIFNQIAPLAQLSGMDFSETLKLITATSKLTKNPEQMGLYAEQILRLFTNVRAITNKKSIVGKMVFDESGNRRSPLDTLQQIKKTFDSLGEKQQEGLISRLTGGADARSLRTIQMFLNSDALKNLTEPKSGNLAEKLPAAVNDAANQAARLKNTLEEAAEKFARPINKVLADAIQWTLDKKKLSGLSIAGIGAGAVGATWLAGTILKGPIGNLLKGKAGVAAGVAEGAMLKQAGVTPVYVVNFSEFSTSMSGGKFQEFLEQPAAKMPKAAMGILPWLGIGGAGISLGAAGLYLGRKLEEKQAAAGTPENERYSNILASHFSGGYTYKPKHALTAANSPGPRQNDQSNFEGPLPPKVETQVNVYIDGEKKKPSKTIVVNRGAF